MGSADARADGAAGVTRKELDWPRLIVMTVGLTLINTWSDIIGHAPAFADSAALFGGIANGRMCFSAGLCLCTLVIALIPQSVRRHDLPLSFAIALLGLAASALYAFAPTLPEPLLCACVGAAFVGVGYGWMEVRLLALASEDSRLPLRQVLACLAVSLVLKTTLSALVGIAPDVVQTAALLALPVLIVVVVRMLGTAAPLTQAGQTRPEDAVVLRMPGRDKATVVVFVLLAAVLSAVARALSNLAYWGGANLIAGDVLVAVVPASVIFLVLASATFLRRTGQLLTNLIPCFLVLLGGFVLLDTPELLPELAMPGFALSLLELLVEMYSHLLFWSSIAVGIVMLQMHPYRVVGMAEATMSACAVVLALLLGGVAGAGKVAVVVSIYVTAIVVFLLFKKLRELNQATAEYAQGAERDLRAFASANGLTARETDVFVLLAQGRDRAYVQEALSLSPGTVKTHVGHVYQKLGVHSKQELITLVQHMWDM